MKWLRRTGSKELDQLRNAMADSEGNPGREYAVSAYDVAQILYDDAGDDPDRSLDLAGLIVVARLGRAALTRRPRSRLPRASSTRCTASRRSAGRCNWAIERRESAPSAPPA